MQTAQRISTAYRLLGLVLLVAAAVSMWTTLLPYGLAELATNYNEPADWLPAGFQETTDLKWFVERFGSDEILVISWPGLTIDAPCLPKLAKRLLAPTQGRHGESVVLYRYVFRGPQVVEALTAPPVNLTREDALARLGGWLIGPDGKTTCVVALVSKAGMADRHLAVDLAYNAVGQECGIPREQVHLGGPTRTSVAIDNASVAYLWDMVFLATATTLLVSWITLRSLLLTVLVYLVASYCQFFALTIMYLTGQQMNSILIIVPPLIFVLAASASIHVINYYLDAARETGWETAIGKAVLDAWLPCTMAAVTTAAGLGSLYLSELMPIRSFGLYAAVATIVSLVLTFLLLPSALTWTSPWIRLAAERRTAALAAAPRRGRRAWKFRPLARFVLGSYRLILLTGLTLFGLFGYAIKDIETSVRLEKMFRPGSAVLGDYSWLEEHLGPLVPVEIVVRFQESSQRSMLDRLILTEKVQQAIEELPDVGASISAATFAPPTPVGTGARQAVQRRILARKLNEQRKALIDTGYLRPDEHEELWRITARVYAMQEVDYDRVLGALRHTVDEVIDREAPGERATIEPLICGGVPLVDSAQRQLLEDLFESFMTAFVMIGLLMLCILWRSFGPWSLAPSQLVQNTGRWLASGALAMVPNLFPIVLVFGTLAWLDIKIDIGTMMTASVALGIAVDDTVHFLNWFQHGMAAGHSRKASVLYAYHSCATAMTQTSLICGLGMLVFVFSQFVPISRFAWLMAASLAAALAGDLVLLPALLVSSLGRLFRRHERTA